jgi:hypothetical protein
LINNASFNKFSIFISKVTFDTHVDLTFFCKNFLFSKNEFLFFNKFFNSFFIIDNKNNTPIALNPKLLYSYLENSYISYCLEENRLNKSKKLQKFVLEFNEYNEEAYRTHTEGFFTILGYLNYELSV